MSVAVLPPSRTTNPASLRRDPRGFQRYGAAALAVACALGIRLLLEPVLHGQSPLLVFVVAVLIAARYGGLGPGLAATTLSGLCGAFFFLRPTLDLRVSAEQAGLAQLAVFGAIGAMVSVLNSRLRAADARAIGRLAALEASEERFRQLNETLETRVADRTEALEAFGYSVSHDLRAPLRAMEGFAQALLEDYGDRLDETGEDYARRMVVAAQRMDTLIRDLLAYSRLSRSEAELRPESLAAAVERVFQAMAADLCARGATVTVEGRLPAVRAQSVMLDQVLTNLLTNAITFVAPGVPPRVRVWAENRAEERGDRVRLWIEDNGIGIAPEHQERIFDVFERLHGIEAYPGTGVGLAIVRKGMERMAGRAGVESEPGRGSRFWIELARAADPAEAAPGWPDEGAEP